MKYFYGLTKRSRFWGGCVWGREITVKISDLKLCKVHLKDHETTRTTKDDCKEDLSPVSKITFHRYTISNVLSIFVLVCKKLKKTGYWNYTFLNLYCLQSFGKVRPR